MDSARAQSTGRCPHKFWPPLLQLMHMIYSLSIIYTVL